MSLEDVSRQFLTIALMKLLHSTSMMDEDIPCCLWEHFVLGLFGISYYQHLMTKKLYKFIIVNL